jgi:hypothetical protein
MYSQRFDRVISWCEIPIAFFTRRSTSGGNPPWNGSSGDGVVVFDGSALDPAALTFVPDGTSAVFGWYETGGRGNAYVQRLSNGGTEQWPHNGVAASTFTVGIRLTPSVAFDPRPTARTCSGGIHSPRRTCGASTDSV